MLVCSRLLLLLGFSLVKCHLFIPCSLIAKVIHLFLKPFVIHVAMWELIQDPHAFWFGRSPVRGYPAPKCFDNQLFLVIRPERIVSGRSKHDLLIWKSKKMTRLHTFMWLIKLVQIEWHVYIHLKYNIGYIPVIGPLISVDKWKSMESMVKVNLKKCQWDSESLLFAIIAVFFCGGFLPTDLIIRLFNFSTSTR